MRITGPSMIAAPRDRVFAALLDPAVLQRVIPGCREIVSTGDGAYRIRIQREGSGIMAAIRGKVEVDLTISDVREPEHVRLAVKSKALGSSVDAFATLDFIDSGEVTEIHYEGEGKIGGVISALGDKALESATRKAMDKFFARFQDEVNR